LYAFVRPSIGVVVNRVSSISRPHAAQQHLKIVFPRFTRSPQRSSAPGTRSSLTKVPLVLLLSTTHQPSARFSKRAWHREAASPSIVMVFSAWRPTVRTVAAGSSLY